MTDEDRVIETFSQMADDYLFAILLIKNTDLINDSSPFLHGHALELSAKAACYKLGIDTKKFGHDIVSIYDKLKDSIPNLEKLRPSDTELKDYKNVWMPSNSPLTTIHIPNPEILFRLELAYFVDNVMNLKYGFTKDQVRVSILEIFSNKINQHFLDLFTACRKVYSNDKLNQRLTKKLISAFGTTDETNRILSTF